MKNAILGSMDSMEHGFFLDGEAVEMMVKHGTFYLPSLALVEVYKKSLEKPFDMPPWRLRKQRECIDAMPKSFLMAYKVGVKIATGPDYFGAPMRAHPSLAARRQSLRGWAFVYESLCSFRMCRRLGESCLQGDAYL